MFIKIFTPNEDGKIELTVKQLEALLQEAADKAVRERCSNCNKGYWYGSVTTTPNITLLSDKANSTPRNGEITWDWNKVTCRDSSTNEPNYTARNLNFNISQEDLNTLHSSVNGQIQLDIESQQSTLNKKEIL